MCFTYLFKYYKLYILSGQSGVFPQGVGPERLILCIARCVEVVGAQDGKQTEESTMNVESWDDLESDIFLGWRKQTKRRYLSISSKEASR